MLIPYRLYSPYTLRRFKTEEVDSDLEVTNLGNFIQLYKSENLYQVEGYIVVLDTDDLTFELISERDFIKYLGISSGLWLIQCDEQIINQSGCIRNPRLPDSSYRLTVGKDNTSITGIDRRTLTEFCIYPIDNTLYCLKGDTSLEVSNDMFIYYKGKISYVIEFSDFEEGILGTYDDDTYHTVVLPVTRSRLSLYNADIVTDSKETKTIDYFFTRVDKNSIVPYMDVIGSNTKELVCKICRNKTLRRRLLLGV